MWLDAVIAEAGRRGLALGTLPEALSRHEPRGGDVLESTWGTGKDLHTWDAPPVADVVWAARESELQLLAALGSRPSDGRAPAARRAARELLALQSSDWAFMASRGLAAEYARERVRNHSLAFREAVFAMGASMTDFGPMNGGPHDQGSDERLRGLAPGLELSPLLAPSSLSPAGGR